MTAVLASVPDPAATAPFGLYAAAAVTFVLLAGLYCVLGVASWRRVLAWIQRREQQRRLRVKPMCRCFPKWAADRQRGPTHLGGWR